MYDSKKPSEKYKLPIIGKIYLKPTSSIFSNFNQHFIDDSSPSEYDVIQIKEYENGIKTYVVDAWNSPNVVQLIPDICVEKFEEK